MLKVVKTPIKTKALQATFLQNSFFDITFGPGVLACATRGGGQSEAGHCFHLLFSFLVQACLRAPHVVADEAKLAIVFTYFFLLLLVQACLCAPHVVADEVKLAIVFTYFFLSYSFFFFFLLRLLLFTHFGESPMRENLFPPIFWHN